MTTTRTDRATTLEFNRTYTLVGAQTACAIVSMWFSSEQEPLFFGLAATIPAVGFDLRWSRFPVRISVALMMAAAVCGLSDQMAVWNGRSDGLHQPLQLIALQIAAGVIVMTEFSALLGKMFSPPSEEVEVNKTRSTVPVSRFDRVLAFFEDHYKGILQAVCILGVALYCQGNLLDRREVGIYYIGITAVGCGIGSYGDRMRALQRLIFITVLCLPAPVFGFLAVSLVIPFVSGMYHQSYEGDLFGEAIFTALVFWLWLQIPLIVIQELFATIDFLVGGDDPAEDTAPSGS